MARLLVSLLAAGGVAWSGMQPAPQLSAQLTAIAMTRPTARSTLRVGMWTLWHDREVVLAPAGPHRNITLRSCADCATLTFTEPARVEPKTMLWHSRPRAEQRLAKRLWLSGPVTLTAHGETVTLQNPVTIAAKAGVLVIVVTLPVESYVERVVASESGPADSAESLKALAIVVRSFALHEPHGHADYDLCDSTHCQLLHWAGNGERRAAAHAAVLATAGETLWFHGQRALAYFGKDCGGRTASPAEIWPHAKPVPYLPSQPDRFCTGDGGREWAAEITRTELTAALAAHGLAAPGWQNLTVVRRGESGRAVTLRLDGREISAEEFRLAVGESLGWNRIPSTWFEVSRQGDRILVSRARMGPRRGPLPEGRGGDGRAGAFRARDFGAVFSRRAKLPTKQPGCAWRRVAGDGFVLESLDGADAAYLPDLNRARAEASERSGLNTPSPFTVRAFASTPAFREATLAPGWVAAFDEGDWIGTQPLRTLAARHLLAGTMRHEFLHALVEQQAGPHAPLWLREGLVEVWSERWQRRKSAACSQSVPRPALTLDAIDSALAHASTEAESAAAHRAAAWYAAQLLAHYGRAQVLEWLRSGLPAGVVAALGQR